MQPLSIFVLSVIFAATTSLAVAQTALYTANARAQGAPLDISVTETKREATRSYLRIPEFNTRTASGQRWLMCAYTDLAIKRGFNYWTVMDPAEGSDMLVVGFSNLVNASSKELFGSEYVDERASGRDMTPVKELMGFCGFHR